MANKSDEWVSPYERPYFIARVKELIAEGRSEHDAKIIADSEFHVEVEVPSDQSTH